MRVFSHEFQLLHDPANEFTGWETREYPECPERCLRVQAELAESHAAHAEFVSPPLCDLKHILAVHDVDYVDFMDNVPEEFDGVVASVFALPPPHSSHGNSFLADLGRFVFDSGTPFTTEVFRSAHSSASVAVAASLDLLGGKNLSVALCRPPGHHASRRVSGGYCYLNNAAIAAQLLRERGRSVAILDIDYHHGNGTQEIFYARDDVLYVSIHADPRVMFPYFWGYKEEIGINSGKGFNLNIPLDPLASEEDYSEAMDTAMTRVNDHAPDVVIVSAGVDTHEQDPIGGMQLSTEYFTEIGKKIAVFPKTCLLLEGGYNLDYIGLAFSGLLKGIICES